MKLRHMTFSDDAALLRLLTDDQIKKTYMLPDFARQEDALPLARRLEERSRDENHFVRGMETDGNLVGFLNDVEVENGTIEVGYVVHPDHWGRGCATAALKLAIEELFRLGYRQVICGAFEENSASLRVMEKAGMRKLDKIDEIEYRGKVHRCLYRGIEAQK